MLCGAQAGEQKAELTIEVPPSQEADFEASLAEKFGLVHSAVSNIDMRNADAFSAKDKQMIRRAPRRAAHGVVPRALARRALPRAPPLPAHSVRTRQRCK